MFAYHAHFNREVWSDEIPFANWRALAVDYLHFDSNGNPYTNGPTYSLQNTVAVAEVYLVDILYRILEVAGIIDIDCLNRYDSKRRTS
mgnify:CR=1 FL=1